MITQRINLGLTAVLGRLHATANFRRIAEELWPFVAGPPSTPMGEAEAAWLARRNAQPNRREFAPHHGAITSDAAVRAVGCYCASGIQLPWKP